MFEESSNLDKSVLMNWKTHCVVSLWSFNQVLIGGLSSKTPLLLCGTIEIPLETYWTLYDFDQYTLYIRKNQ